MTSAADIRRLFDRCLEIAASKRDMRLQFAELKEDSDPEGKIDWPRLMALAIAYDGDQQEGAAKNRVEKLIAKAEYANWYAEILKLGNPEQKDQIRSSTTASEPHRSPSASPSVAADNVISLEGGRPGHSPMRAGGDNNAPSKEATPPDAGANDAPRRPLPPARHDPLPSQSVASDLVLTTSAPTGDGEATVTSALAVASSFLCTACGAEREEAETLCWSCRAADLPEYRVSDSELVAGSTPSVARGQSLNCKVDGEAVIAPEVAASTNSPPAMGAGPTNDDDQFNRIPDVLDRNRVTA